VTPARATPTPTAAISPNQMIFMLALRIQLLFNKAGGANKEALDAAFALL
jgi:hypothetical protein